MTFLYILLAFFLSFYENLRIAIHPLGVKTVAKVGKKNEFVSPWMAKSRQEGKKDVSKFGGEMKNHYLRIVMKLSGIAL